MAGSGGSSSSAWVFPSRSCFVPFAPPPALQRRNPVSRVSRARAPVPGRARYAAARFARLIAQAHARAREPGAGRTSPVSFPRSFFRAGAKRERAQRRGRRALPPALSYHGFSGVKPALRNALPPPAGVQSGSRARSRSTNVCSFPVEAFGRVPDTIRRGALKRAILSRQKAITAASVGSAPDLLSAYFPSFAATFLPTFQE